MTEGKLVEVCTDAHSQIGALMSKFVSTYTDTFQITVNLLLTLLHICMYCIIDPDKVKYKGHSLDKWHVEYYNN